MGLIEGIANASTNFIKIISGRISDSLNKRKSFAVLGYGISEVVKPIYAFVLAPWQALFIRLFDYAGKGVREAPRDALISISMKDRHLGKGFGFHRAADTVGGAFGPLLAFILLPLLNYNVRALFLISALAGVIAMVVLVFYVKEIPAAIRPEEKKQSFQLKNLGLPFNIFLIGVAVFSLGKASEAFLLLRAQSAGVILLYIPLIYFVYSLVYAIFSVPAGILSDKIGHRNTFMIGMLIFAATYLLFGSWANLVSIWFIFAIYGFYSAFTDGVGRAIVADLVEEKWRATAYGIYNAAIGTALLPGSIVFGVLWDVYGPQEAFFYGAILAILALIIFLFLRFENRKGYLSQIYGSHKA